MPQLHGARDRQQAEDEREHGHAGLHRDDQPPLVDAIGDHARIRREDQYRHHLQRDDEAELRARAGQRVDQPALGDRLHPGAHERDALAGVPAPVVRVGERRERAAPDGSGAHARMTRGRTRRVAAQALGQRLERRQRGAAVCCRRRRRARRGARPGSRCARRGCARAAPCPAAVASTRAARRSLGVGLAADQPRLGQARCDAREHRRVDPLDLGELGQPQRAAARDRREDRELGGGESLAGVSRTQVAGRDAERDAQPLDRLSLHQRAGARHGLQYLLAGKHSISPVRDASTARAYARVARALRGPGRQFDHERGRPREAVRLPGRRAAGVGDHAAQRQCHAPREARLEARAAAGDVDRGHRLVEPDRDVGLQPPDEQAREAALGLRQRRRAGVERRARRGPRPASARRSCG